MATHRHKNTKTGIVIPDNLEGDERGRYYSKEYHRRYYIKKRISPSERGQVFKRQERIISISRIALQRLNINQFSITINKILRGEMVMAP